MKGYFNGLTFLWILLATPLAASTSRIYVMNLDGGPIDVIDPITNRVVQSIKGISRPHDAVFSPDGTRAYITDEADRVLDVVDTKSGDIIQKVHLSGIPNVPAITNDGKRILVCIAAPSGAMDIVDTTTLQVVKTLQMKDGMHDMYTTPDGKYAVAGSINGKVAIVIDLRTEQPAWEIQFDRGVLTMAIESGPDGSTSRIFVNLEGLRGFAVVDFVTHKEVGRINFPDQPNWYRFVSQHGGLTDNPTHGSAVAPDGKTLWVCSKGANAVFVYSLPELKLLGQVYMPELLVPEHSVQGGDPHWVTLTADSKTAYVSNATVELVSAIDVKTLKEVARIQVGKNARHVSTLVLP
jgi:YVTN family beta-propeller protein